MMYTFLFTFINPNTGKEDQTEYCAETDKEAIEGFQDFCSDESFNSVPDYDMEIIYSHDDADYYGMDYGCPDEYPDKGCSTCIYCSQEKGNSFFCLNQSSRKFGKKLSSECCPMTLDSFLRKAYQEIRSNEEKIRYIVGCCGYHC